VCCCLLIEITLRRFHEWNVIKWKLVVELSKIHFFILAFFIVIFSAGGLVTAVAPVVIKGKGQWVSLAHHRS
jgi:hypothetical protein